MNNQASCNTCHNSPPSLNPYGADVKRNLAGSIAETLIHSLDQVAALDSDGDGVTNIDEIMNQGRPGDASVSPVIKASLSYDPVQALKRIKGIYCGDSAGFDELQMIRSAAEPKALLHETLSTCLKSTFWNNEALFRLADKKIQPLAAIGFGGNVVIADYRYDYRLFSYVLSDDHDVRELLTAQYHIDSKGNRVEGTIGREESLQFGSRIVLGGGQPLEPSRRAGMMTTQWFLTFYTMFSELPRNTASQAYREYLGMDIAKSEGLMPVVNEPRDVDNRNVAQPACAVCHSTLDPLAYSFSAYSGIEGNTSGILFNSSGTYNPSRTNYEADGHILGEPVADLLDWADKAKNSEAFSRNIAKMMFTQAMRRDPAIAELTDFDSLWQGLPADGYSVNKMLHRFIDTLTFGGRTK